MFDFFKKQIPLKVGQIWEMEEKNPFASKWRSEIKHLKDGYVLYFTYPVSPQGNKKYEDFHGLDISDTEKRFRFFNVILINE